MRKIIAIFSLCLAALFSFQENASAVQFTAFEKNIGHLSDELLRGMDSNVLIYLDITNPMVMSMKGQLPIFRWVLTATGGNTTTPDDAWMRLNQPQMRNAAFRASLIAQNTYGTGTRPVSEGTMAQQAPRLNNTNPPAGQVFVPPHLGTELPNLTTGNALSSTDFTLGTRWGRDVDFSNNIIGHPDCYYTPDPARPFLLTFKDVNWANWNGVGTPPNSHPDYRVSDYTRPGHPVVSFGNQPMPAELRAHLPGGSRAGQPVTDPNLVRHLVPNDSKMYKLKLVLWRILYPNQDNFHLLSRMRLGLATTFFEQGIDHSTRSSGAVFASMFLPTYGVNTNFSAWHAATDAAALTSTSVNFPHGVIDGFLAGYNPPTTATGFPQRATSFGGVLTSYRESGEGTRHAGRSLLRVPFDFMYTREGDGNFSPTQALVNFRELIDGVEQIDRSASGLSWVDRFVNQELTPTGLVHTAERKMFGRGSRGENWLINDAGVNQIVMNNLRAIAYAEGAEGSRTAQFAQANNRGVPMRRIRNSEGFMTGTALGDVLDFFSPHANVLPYRVGTGTTGLGDTRGYFPVTGPCQNNWIIYFSTGNENLPGWIRDANDVRDRNYETGANRSMMRTLLDIHYGSRVMRGRAWSGSEWVETLHEMDNPIRTIIVGLVSTEGMYSADGTLLDGDPYDRILDRTLPTEARLRNAIRRMAHAGQPLVDRDVYGRPNWNTLRPDRSVEPIFAANVEELIQKLYAALYAIQSGNLAAGAPNIQPAVETGSGEPALFAAAYVIDPHRQWRSSFSKYVIRGVLTPSIPDPDWRGAGTAGGDAGRIMIDQVATRGNRLYTTDITAGTGAGTGQGQGSITLVRDMVVSTGGNDVFRTRFGIPVHHAQGDYNHAFATCRCNACIFRRWLIDYHGDGSGVLGDMENSVPRIVMDTATHNRRLGNAVPRIYLHTNRGVLHSINYSTGEEIWGFIPPLAQNPYVRNKRFTDNGATFLSGNDEKKSRAITILDGMLMHRDLNLPGTGGNRTYMVGAMGLGGAGFYMMDITNPNLSVPQFVFAINNPRYATPTNIGDIARWGQASGGNQAIYDYRDLGFTIAAPEIRRIESNPHYVGIIPGGLGYNLGADSQGKALFIFDPTNGQIHRRIHDGDGYIRPTNVSLSYSRMGMVIMPVFYVVLGDGTLRDFFTGDSEGNVLHCRNPDATLENWTLKSIFRARNLGDVPGSVPGGPIALPVSYAIGSGSGARWLFAGTANVPGPEGRELENTEQYIFALNLNNHPAYTGSSTEPMTLADLGRIRRHGDDPRDYGPDTGPNSRGWHIRLRERVTGDFPRDGEYVSAPPFLYQGTLYVATFTPHTWNPGGGRERCVATGDGRLYALNPMTGAPMWGKLPDEASGTAQSLLFRNVKIVGVSAFGGNLFLGVRPMASGALGSFNDHDDTRDHTIHAGGSVVEIKGVLRAPPPSLIETDVPHVQYWRELIR